jgi:hypothetical protein
MSDEQLKGWSFYLLLLFAAVTNNTCLQRGLVRQLSEVAREVER